MSSTLLSMFVFALVGAITPGPVNLLAIRHGASAGIVAATGFVAGASLSYTLVVWLTGKGAVNLVSYPLATEAMRWLGAAYLAYLAWSIATAPPGSLRGGEAASRTAAYRASMEGFLVQAANPKAWLVALSGIALFVLPQPDADGALWRFCTVSLLACGLGVGCWAVAGRLLARWLAPAARQRRFNRLLGFALAIATANMLL